GRQRCGARQRAAPWVGAAHIDLEQVQLVLESGELGSIRGDFRARRIVGGLLQQAVALDAALGQVLDELRLAVENRGRDVAAQVNGRLGEEIREHARTAALGEAERGAQLRVAAVSL